MIPYNKNTLMRINFKQVLMALVLLIIVFVNNTNAQNQEQNNSIDNYTDIRDGRVYKTVEIGTQIWFAENFAYLPEVDTLNISVYGYKGTSVKEAKNTDSYKKYGALYTWEKANQLAPKGWRLPTDADWIQLETATGMPKELALKHEIQKLEQLD